MVEQEPNVDLALVQRVQAGDKRAFDLLVRKYQHKLTSVISRYIHDWAECQDVAQESFIRAYRALGNFRGDAQFYTWLYRIAVNTAKKAMVELSRNPVLTESALRGNDDDDETSAPGRELTSDETPETVIAAQEIAEAVTRLEAACVAARGTMAKAA